MVDCKEKDTTYAAPLKVTFMLEKKERGTVEQHEVYLGDLPLMTETGSFIVNGTERVVVSQMVRSPSIYFDMTRDKIGKKLYNATMIPNRGAWIELESDSNDPKKSKSMDFLCPYCKASAVPSTSLQFSKKDSD